LSAERWLPVAFYLLMADAVWQDPARVAYGVPVIGLIDNLPRPVLVRKDTRMPDCVAMFSTLGGMVVFGINGFVIGPVIAAMFIAVLHVAPAARANPPPRVEPHSDGS
jgi:predicted PurR-regulated permease PerM